MRVGSVLALAAAVAVTPTFLDSVAGIDLPLAEAERLLRGEANLTELAEEIAVREYSPNATLEVLEVTLGRERNGTFGETIRPDRGNVYHFALVRVTNVGKVDLSVATWQFVSEDDVGSEHAALLANERDDFDGSRLPPGASREGVVVFELHESARLVAVAWEGDLTSARGERGGDGAASSQRPAA